MKFDRRELLLAGGAAAVLPRCAGTYDMGLDGSESYDEVIDAAQVTDFEFPKDNGFTNHVPMVADALFMLDAAGRIASWAQSYGKSLKPLPSGEPLSDGERAGAMNDYALRARWIATYLKDLETLTPRELFNQQWPLLKGALVGSLWHGWIRTAHAARSFDRDPNPTRRHEFAEGMAYWMARWPPLEVTPGARATAGRDVLTALNEMPLVPTAQRSTKGDLESQVLVLAGRQDFKDAVEAVDLSALPVDRALTELTAAAARWLVNDGTHSIGILHAITGTAATRLLLPWMDAATQREAVGYSFMALASYWSVHAKSAAHLAPVAAASKSYEALLGEGKASDDVHDVKLTEVVAREKAIDERPELLAALEKWMA
jgi:hypothetical protein